MELWGINNEYRPFSFWSSDLDVIFVMILTRPDTPRLSNGKLWADNFKSFIFDYLFCIFPLDFCWTGIKMIHTLLKILEFYVRYFLRYYRTENKMKITDNPLKFFAWIAFENAEDWKMLGISSNLLLCRPRLYPDLKQVRNWLGSDHRLFSSWAWPISSSSVGFYSNLNYGVLYQLIIASSLVCRVSSPKCSLSGQQLNDLFLLPNWNSPDQFCLFTVILDDNGYS